ncbi:glycoside hydrolase family 3 N-terminal domain-containing protein [Wenxinia marina]|uniref:beta-N-acetylhexosaminidase n=1 Tax=Wenxinia marina DSM 24838 TaxID=1123501 RepID=A0A0D0P8E7_9RHOB|nr:glycoside hydrolase family 3 N-terminal domain-containing protein [Wenxinia marina]KIQ67856.1 Beta-glucosidase-related glycosidase [Wenxinia marina DSM 24838]GGL74537.1 beta-N-acetylhexosaminidase [Wenxinia marina]
MAPVAAIIGLEGTTIGPEERAFLREADPWGAILFGRNVDSPDQLRVLTSDFREIVGRNAPVLIDQEGGRVQRLRAPHWREFLPALDQMKRATNPMRAQWVRNRLIAHELREVGVDVNCAPLADLVEAGTHPVLLNRLYGDDVATVVDAARAAADGMLAGGVLPVLKHIPGYGRAQVDSHLSLPRIDAAAGALAERDFAPFRALSDLPMGMTAHIVFSRIDADRAATVSPSLIAMIRDQIGFDGLLMSDDLGMEALSGTPAERTRATLAAGCDVALYGNGTLDDRRAVAEAAPVLQGQALTRAEAALARRHPPEPVDIGALDDELGALLA